MCVAFACSCLLSRKLPNCCRIECVDWSYKHYWDATAEQKLPDVSDTGHRGIDSRVDSSLYNHMLHAAEAEPSSGFRLGNFSALSSGSGHTLDQAIDAVGKEHGVGFDSADEEGDEEEKDSTQEQVR